MKPMWSLVLVLIWTLDLVCGEDPPDVCSSMTVRLRSFRIITSPCNFTTLRESQLDSVQSWSLVLVLPLVQILVLVLALPSNLVALWILLFRSKRTASTSLLVTLTVCDLMVLLALPFRAVYHLSGNHWVLGEALCRLVVALFYGNMYGSVLCLAFIATDRYVALVHPFRAKLFRSRRTSLLMVLGVWLTVVAAMLPLLLTRQTFDLDEPRITTCHDALPQSQEEALFLPYFLCLFCLCFAVPLVVVVFCHGAILHTLLRHDRYHGEHYHRERYGRAVRATALVLLVFAVSFVPSNVLLLLSLTDDSEGAEPDLYAPYMLSLALSAVNTLLDPFIYYYVSSDFRDKALNAICCRRNRTAVLASPRQQTKLTLLSPPTDPSTNHSTDPPTDPPTNHSTDPPTDLSINHSTDPPTDPPTNHSTDPPTNHSTDPPTDPPTNHSTDPPTNHSTDPPTDPSTNHSTEV